MSERRLLLASRARHKVAELQQLLDLPGVTLVTPDEVGIEGEPVEDADTFEGNAEIKARYYSERSSGMPVLADDSGLEVDALDGRPGVYTKRYAGEDPTDVENNTKLLGELDGLPPEHRGARYQCVLAFIDPTVGGDPVFTAGSFEGRIATGPRGHGGFGYDPIFEPASEAPGARTVGLMTADEKHALSHRGKAARVMAEYLRGEGW